VRQLSIETVLGATKLASLSEETVSALRERVTSKEGTTEAALYMMGKRGFKEAVIAGAKAAKERGAELGELFGKD
jgi:pyrroline-5-carboxylate reductase